MVAKTNYEPYNRIVCEGETHGFTLQFEIDITNNNNRKIYSFHLFINDQYIHSFGIC